jgi:hypothetical protein
VHQVRYDYVKIIEMKFLNPEFVKRFYFFENDGYPILNVSELEVRRRNRYRIGTSEFIEYQQDSDTGWRHTNPNARVTTTSKCQKRS